MLWNTRSGRMHSLLVTMVPCWLGFLAKYISDSLEHWVRALKETDFSPVLSIPKCLWAQKPTFFVIRPKKPIQKVSKWLSINTKDFSVHPSIVFLCGVSLLPGSLTVFPEVSWTVSDCTSLPGNFSFQNPRGPVCLLPAAFSISQSLMLQFVCYMHSHYLPWLLNCSHYCLLKAYNFRKDKTDCVMVNIGSSEGRSSFWNVSTVFYKPYWNSLEHFSVCLFYHLTPKLIL